MNSFLFFKFLEIQSHREINDLLIVLSTLNVGWKGSWVLDEVDDYIMTISTDSFSAFNVWIMLPR